MYTTVDAVRSNMAQLPERVTNAYITSFIQRADTLINSYLAGIYSIPFITPMIPKLVSIISLDLTVFFLYEALYSSNAPNLDEYQMSRYERSIRLLERIQKGEIGLEDAPPIDQEHNGAGYDSTTSGMTNIFSYEDPEW